MHVGSVRCAGEQMLQGGKLQLPFLHAVLAEQAQPGGVGLRHRLGGMHLADRHQRDFSLRATSAATGIGDLLSNEREVLSQRHPGSILWVFRRIVDGRTRVAGCVADWVECFYDLRLVWTPEVQGSGTVEGDPGELGDRVLRVLPAGAGEPDRLPGILRGPVEGDPGGDHAERVWRLLRVLLWRPAALEPRGGSRVPGAWRFLYVSQILRQGGSRRKKRGPLGRAFIPGQAFFTSW